MFIRLENICKVYSGTGYKVDALNNINLDINKGEMLAIMGASGSGKSTLLNIIGCIDHPTSGRYIFREKNMTELKEKEIAKYRNKVFGFVLQDFALIERYSVSKNIRIPMIYSGVGIKEQKKRTIEMLKLLGIEDKKNQLPIRLSGGQRQRVAISRALINDAEIILCDEPTGALDSVTGMEIVSILKKLNEQGKTIIIVTHDEKVAQKCNRVLVLSDGKI